MASFTLNRNQVREIDQRAIEEHGMSGLVLMENAGRGCVDVLLKLGALGPVLVVCGKGNNGGDGFVIARHLDNGRIPVTLALLCPACELIGDAAANFRWLKETNTKILSIESDDFAQQLTQSVEHADWIIDAMLGTGATGAPRSPFDAVIRQLNAAPARRMAIDVPSGLDCDTGECANPTFRADRTCTFVASKPGLLAKGAQACVGIIHVVDIGVPQSLVTEVNQTVY